MYLRILVALVVGSAAGVALAAATRASVDPVASAPSGSCPHRLADRRSELDILIAEYEREAAATNRLRTRRARRLSASVPWPEHVPPELAPEALRDHFEATLEGTSARLLDLDCAAYPCVATLAQDHPAGSDPAFVVGQDGSAIFDGALLARIIQEGTAYANLPFFEAGRTVHAGPDGIQTVHSVMFYDRDELLRADRPDDPQRDLQDGNRLEQFVGRVHHKADSAAAGERR
jgi:hypothetical protein